MKKIAASKMQRGHQTCASLMACCSSVAGKLQQLCAALNAGDCTIAGHVQVQLTTSDWDECSAWLTALKRLIKVRQMGG